MLDRDRPLAAGRIRPLPQPGGRRHGPGRQSGDDRALAAAYTVQALVAAQDGDRLANDTNYLRALDHAERAGDVLQIVRIRLNRGSRLSEEGFHEDAIAELDLAIGLADLGGYGSFKAIALCNRGEARGALGRFDEALDDVEGSKAIFQRMGSLTVAYPLGQAGALHAARGQTALAYAAFAEAIDVARRSGDRQGLVPGAHRPGPARRGRRPVPRRRPGRRGGRGRGRRAGRVRRAPDPGLGRPRRR